MNCPPDDLRRIILDNTDTFPEVITPGIHLLLSSSANIDNFVRFVTPVNPQLSCWSCGWSCGQFLLLKQTPHCCCCLCCCCLTNDAAARAAASWCPYCCPCCCCPSCPDSGCGCPPFCPMLLLLMLPLLPPSAAAPAAAPAPAAAALVLLCRCPCPAVATAHPHVLCFAAVPFWSPHYRSCLIAYAQLFQRLSDSEQ